jgi:hypothetical protein
MVQEDANWIMPRLLAGLSLIVLSMISCQPAMSAEPETPCWRDYPIPTDAVNYEKTLLSETLAPDRILINGKIIRPGMTESHLNSVLGLSSTVLEEWQQRTDQDQCEYLLEILRKHPNSMHLYKLGELKWKKMSGFFRVSEWKLPNIATLRAFFYKPFSDAAESAYLYQLTLFRTPADEVKRKKGQDYVLVRKGWSDIEWNVEVNRVSIVSRSKGK